MKVKRPIRALALAVLALAALNSCVAQPGSGARESVSPAGTRTPSIPPAMVTATPGIEATASPSVIVALPRVPSTCHLTKPDQRFVPPAGSSAPVRPPDYYDSEWYGHAPLWTMLRRDGEIWFALPHGPDGFGQKTFWWSAGFDVSHEPQPAISVKGRQLDGPRHFASPAPGTNAGADFGSAMLTGVSVPMIGCWQITATYRQASLSYVAWVGD